jgi:MFS family permease
MISTQLNEAGTARQSGRYETWLMVLLSLAFGFVFFDRNSMNFLAPFVAPELGLNNTQIGMLASGFSFAWALAGYFGGRLSDASGRRKSVVLVAFVIFSLCSFLSGMASGFVMLLASRILMGLAEGPILPISQSLVALESTESRRGFNMGFMQNFGSNLLGSFVAPLVLVALATHYGWRNAFYIAGIPGFILAIFIWKFVREPKTHAVGSATVAPDPGVAAGARAMRITDMFKFRNMWICVLMSIFMVPWMILAWVFMPLFYVNFRHFSPEDMGKLMSVLGVSAALFGFLVPALSDRIGRKPVMVGFSLIGVLCPLAALYYSGSLVALGTLIFIGWSASGVFPLFMATIPSETIPARYIATSLGIVMGLGELIGGVATPSIAGWAADLYGLQAPILIEAGCAVVATVLALFLVETAPVKVKARSAPGSQPVGTPMRKAV